MLRPIDQSVMSGYNSHPTAGYSPLPVTFCEVAWMSADGRRLGVKPSRPGPEQRAPWARHVRPGRNDNDDVRRQRRPTGDA